MWSLCRHKSAGLPVRLLLRTEALPGWVGWGGRGRSRPSPWGQRGSIGWQCWDPESLLPVWLLQFSCHSLRAQVINTSSWGSRDCCLCPYLIIRRLADVLALKCPENSLILQAWPRGCLSCGCLAHPTHLFPFAWHDSKSTVTQARVLQLLGVIRSRETSCLSTPPEATHQALTPS